MSDSGWLCVGLAALAVAGCAYVSVLGCLHGARFRARLAAEGVNVVARVAAAEARLFRPASRLGWGDSCWAQVAFTRRGDDSAAHLEWLREFAEKLDDFVAASDCGGDEYWIGAIRESLLTGLSPLRLPERLAGGAEVYAASVIVRRSKLPGGRLTRPGLRCRVLFGEGGGAEVLDYARP